MPSSARRASLECFHHLKLHLEINENIQGGVNYVILYRLLELGGVKTHQSSFHKTVTCPLLLPSEKLTNGKATKVESNEGKVFN